MENSIRVGNTRAPYLPREATVRTRHGTMDWFQTGKGVLKAVYCHPVYLTYMQSTSCKMLGWMKYKLESRLQGEISITSDMQMTPPLWQKMKRNWRASWWWWKRRVHWCRYFWAKKKLRLITYTHNHWIKWFKKPFEQTYKKLNHNLIIYHSENTRPHTFTS